jgi:hypothetical protein
MECKAARLAIKGEVGGNYSRKTPMLNGNSQVGDEQWKQERYALFATVETGMC